MAHNFQDIERALVAGLWTSQASSSSCKTSIVDLAEKVAKGNFRDVLLSDECKHIFTIANDPGDHDALFDIPFESWFALTLDPRNSGSDYDEGETELLHLIVGIACFHAFIQVNWTGPDLDILPSSIIQPPPGATKDLEITEDSLNAKAVMELAYGGEPAYHLAAIASFLRFAQILFGLPYKVVHSSPWWTLRATIIHVSVLDDVVAVPESVLSSVEPLFSTLASQPVLGGRLALEQGLLEHRLGRNKQALEFFKKGAQITGLEYEVTGALGKRTKFQVDALSQLVLLAESKLPDDEADTKSGNKAEGTSDTKSIVATDSKSTQENGASSHLAVSTPSNVVVPETLALNDDTLLERTAFNTHDELSGDLKQPGPRLRHIDPSAPTPLHPLDQCIILALCLNVKNTSPEHGLTNEEMTPYVERVIQHPRNWSVHTMALLLRSRLEANRTRTVERSTLQLQALVEQMPTADADIDVRLLYIHDLPLPSKWSMERELALRLLSLGVARSAKEIFERLEMWEQVVQCYQVLDEPGAGVRVVRDLLEGKKREAEAALIHAREAVRADAPTSERRRNYDAAREAKLWCLLGDLEPNNAVEHYQQAWKVSGQTSGRAMRSLGAYYFTLKQYKEAIPCFQKGLEINPIMPRSWFTLGCACVWTEQWREARLAFQRCVSLEDEDAESWNNLASVYLKSEDLTPPDLQINVEDDDEEQDQPPKPTVTSDIQTSKVPYWNKVLAYRALKQGLKGAYENWRMWENYMVVATDIHEYGEACYAFTRIVEERTAKDGAACVDVDVLNILVTVAIEGPPKAAKDRRARELERRNAAAGLGNPTAEGDKAMIGGTNPIEGTRLRLHVFDLIEKTILTRVSSSRIFRIYARLLAAEKRYVDAVEAYLGAYRAYISEAPLDEIVTVEKWKMGLAHVEDIVEKLRVLGPLAEEEWIKKAEGEGGDDADADAVKAMASTKGKKWVGQARNIVRTFMSRTRSNFEDQPEWEKLTELMKGLTAAGFQAAGFQASGFQASGRRARDE